MKSFALNSRYAFAANPIRIQDEGADTASLCRYALSAGDTVLYSGCFMPPLDIDISDVVNAFVAPMPKVPDDNEAPVVLLEDFSRPGAGRVFNFSISTGSSFVFTGLPGGVSRQNFGTYAAGGIDAFQARFLNYKGNFFLTLRSSFPEISIRETELVPLYFISDPGISEFCVTELLSGKKYTVNNLAEGIYALDLEAMRKWFFVNHAILCNCFEISVSGSKCAFVSVNESRQSKNRIIVRFKNSFGIYELLEMTGDVDLSYSMSEGEDDATEYEKYDNEIGLWAGARSRVPLNCTLSAQTGPICRSDLPLLLDMLTSDDVEVSGCGLVAMKVLPSAEELVFPADFGTPQVIPVSFKCIVDETSGGVPIHDVEHSKFRGLFEDKYNNNFI